MSDLRSLTIMLDLPPVGELSQNARHGSPMGRRISAVAKRRYQEHVISEARLAWGPGEYPRWERATVGYAFYFPDNRERDEVNYIAAMKCAIDALVKVGFLAGDNWQRLHMVEPVFGIDPETPRAMLHFERVEE